MTEDEFMNEVGVAVYRSAHLEHNRCTGNNSLGGILQMFNCALDFVSEGIVWDHSFEGSNYWEAVYDSLNGDAYVEDIPTYTRQPTRKRMKQPLWVRCSE